MTTNETLALKHRLANIKDELEKYGWDPRDTERYIRHALKALPLEEVVALIDEMAVEDARYYLVHRPLADDQLDHTIVAA